MNDIWPHWSNPLLVDTLLTTKDRKRITPDQQGGKRFTGVYAFTSDPGPISKQNILYVGIARGGKQSIRNRVACYLRRMARGKATLSKHAGSDMLLKHFVEGDQRLGAKGSGASKSTIFLRWSKTEDPEQYEGMLIAKYDPPYNDRNEPDYSAAEFELDED